MLVDAAIGKKETMPCKVLVMHGGKLMQPAVEGALYLSGAAFPADRCRLARVLPVSMTIVMEISGAAVLA